MQLASLCRFPAVLVWCLASLLLAVPAQRAAAAVAQEAPKAAAKARLAIRKLDATASVLEAAKRASQSEALQQILEGSDGQLLNAIEATRKFTVVARKDLQEVFKERDLGDSGLVGGQGDPGLIQDSDYLLTMTVDNFQDVVTRAEIEGQLGASTGERREITIQAVVKIFNSKSGALLRSSSQTVTRKQFAEVIAGQSRDGRATNKLLGEVSRDLALRAANEITDFVYPPRVIAFTNGVITLNRTKESGVETGQWWEVFAAGAEMVDPDTGESLGAEEVHIGWARVTDAGAKFSKAQCYADSGVGCDSILRRVDAAPEGADRLEKSSGSCDPGAQAAAVRPVARSQAGRASAEPARCQCCGAPLAGASAPSAPPQLAVVSDSGALVASAEDPIRLAIFVKNRAPTVADANVIVLEESLVSHATTPIVEIISREDAVNAVSRFASEGPNKGTRDPKALEVDQVLSDSTSAVNLSRSMGAAALLTSSITSLTKSERRLKDADLGIDRTVHEQVLTVGYRIIDGTTGGSLAASDVVVRSTWQTGGNLSREAPPIEDLLREAGKQLAAKLLELIRSGGMRKPSEAKDEVDVEIRMTIVDLAVPEIIMQDGKPVISSGSYKLEPTAVNVYVDGLLVGAAPGRFKVAPGIHRIKCERPMFKTYEGMASFRPGMTLVIPMQLTDEGLTRLKDNAKFFQDLKERSALSEAQGKLAEGYAEFLRNSEIRIDTSSLKSLSIENNYWLKLLKK